MIHLLSCSYIRHFILDIHIIFNNSYGCKYGKSTTSELCGTVIQIKEKSCINECFSIL